ncbi:hypothetical protein L1987_85500 [Smallanthus sonchifolius]|uniref:Uncharacterized protein n=1 Tax=Smallanthus sonchifolius TaxID=185202 RepID=A0ACB8XYA0_9ASTR|nr:hypothetical protein L1987_85500 [Smallanthus sonchifolius]
MDWLSKNQAEIGCREKIVRLPLPNEETLSVQGEMSGAVMGITSFLKAQKCLRKGHTAILALVNADLLSIGLKLGIVNLQVPNLYSKPLKRSFKSETVWRQLVIVKRATPISVETRQTEFSLCWTVQDTNETLAVPLEELHIDEQLRFVEEPMEIMDREIKTLKHSKIPIVRVRWNSKRGPKFTWEREDQMIRKYPHLFKQSTSNS